MIFGIILLFFVITFGEMITNSRLSWCKSKLKSCTNQIKNAFYRVFLHLIDVIECKMLFISYLIKITTTTK